MERETPLTDAQQKAIRDAAEHAYDKLRWKVGDCAELWEELILLAKDSFFEGMKQESSNRRRLGYVPERAL